MGQANGGQGEEPAPMSTARDGQASRGNQPPWDLVAFLLVAATFLYFVREILVPFVVAAVFAYVLSPAVAWIQRRARVPRFVAVALVYLLAFGPVGAIVWAAEPTLVRESRELTANAPSILRNVIQQLVGGGSIEFLGVAVNADAAERFLRDAARDFVGGPGQAIHFAARIAEAVLGTFLTVVVLFYFLLDPRPFGRAAIRIVPSQHRPAVRSAAAEIHVVLGSYLRGLLFLVALMSLVTWLGLALIFHLPYSLPIAVATGLLEIIPFLGPVLAATIAVMVGIAQLGPGAAIGIAVFYLVMRQLEDQLVMPYVLGRAVELHPAVNIFAVLAGGALWGVLGALLGIPIAAAIKVAFERWRPAE